MTRSHTPSDDFDTVVVPHLDSAYRLARWLMGNDHDAEDVVQEASLRAFRYFRTFTGGNGRAWFLRIVRNTCWGWRAQRLRDGADLFDEEQHSDRYAANDPETLLMQHDTASAVVRAIEDLPERWRTLFVLRELDGLSYRELADRMEIPIGTVMSGLSRARQSFRGAMSAQRTPPHSIATARPAGRADAVA